MQVYVQGSSGGAASNKILFGDFQIFKAEGNLAEELEVNDIIVGYWSADNYLKARYLGGDTQNLASYLELENTNLIQD